MDRIDMISQDLQVFKKIDRINMISQDLQVFKKMDRINMIFRMNMFLIIKNL
jgi:hypothetical protein